jgi:uncharacterized protein with HEPN domain
MEPESRKYLYDMSQAAHLLLQFSEGRTFEEYTENPMLRSAVERQFEILGEALSQLNRRDPETARRIPEHRRIISFRNVLIHGYAAVDDRIVWGVLQQDAPRLIEYIDELLDESRAGN